MRGAQVRPMLTQPVQKQNQNVKTRLSQFTYGLEKISYIRCSSLNLKFIA